MTRRYSIRHDTVYRYGVAVTDGYTATCLVPRPTNWQRVVSSEVTLEPTPTEWDSYLDGFGNLVHQFGLHEPHRTLSISARSVVEIEPVPDPVDPTPWEHVVAELDAVDGDLAIETGLFRSGSLLVPLDEMGGALEALGRASFGAGRGIVDATRDLSRSIFEQYEFDAQFSNVSTPLADVVAARRGVCQDFAHLAVGCLRSLGLAARYVSGYIETTPPPGGERLVGADASHAWCSVWTPIAGWVDFDPTNGHLPVNAHVTIGWGRDYADITPVRGVMIGPPTTQMLEVAVDVDHVDL